MASTNPRGIPIAPFIDDVEAFAPTRADVAPALTKFQEMIAKYQFMELNTTRRATSLRAKIPDITKTHATVSFLGARADDHGLATFYELNDTLYAKARVEVAGEVFLWLGANVMLAYPVDEAEALLREKLRAAKESLRNCEEDLEFLRRQITTLEVNTARVYNWEVTLKRREREEGEGK